MGQTAMEKQDRIISQFMRTAKYPSQIPSIVETIVAENKNRKVPVQKEHTAYIGGIGYNLSPERAAEIKATVMAEINNRETNKKAKRKSKAAATKIRNAQAIEDKVTAETAKFKAMIAKKAQEQIAAR